MSDILILASIPSDARWSYDDPSGVAEDTRSPSASPTRFAAESSAPPPATVSRPPSG